MKTKEFIFTSEQVRNFIYLCEGEDVPMLLQSFHERNCNAHSLKEPKIALYLDETSRQFLLKELKQYILFLEQEIANYKQKKDLSCDYSMYNRIRVKLAKKSIEVLSKN